MLRRYASGWYPCFLGDQHGGAVGWRKFSHRGLQFLDKIHLGKKQRYDVNDKSFDVRYDTAFDRVLAACADLSRDGATWITPGLVERFAELHRLGYAHSFECWAGGQLVGGSFGLQLGALMTVESMFHVADNASKAAYVRTLLHLRARGFVAVDVNDATPFFQRFGAETVRQWRYEEILRGALGSWPTLTEGIVARRLPVGGEGEPWGDAGVCGGETAGGAGCGVR